MTIFAAVIPAEFRPRVYASLVADLGMPLIAWQLLKAIAARRERKSRQVAAAQAP